MKTYLIKEDFWIGEINKGVKAGETLGYDADKNILEILGKSYDVKNLKAAIKAAWLVPQDSQLPELDGPVGESAEEESARKRKDRFVALSKLENKNKIEKDSSEIARIVGGSFEEGTPEYYAAMGIDPKPKQRGKFKVEIIEDDTKVVATLNKNEEVTQIKKALNSKLNKKSVKSFEIIDDHFNDGMIQVSKYVDENKEQTIKTWSQLHWTKKADVIKTAGKEFLNKIKIIESSAKIINRIDTRLGEL